ncbi:MAG: S24 family peptidase [Bacteroidales bacterium]|nr:S24 family peptidase [Bacteroidales bacterium]
MTAIDRIEALVKHMHTNIKSFSELCGYERPQAFYDILKGKTKNISSTMCDRILSVFPHINRVWLLTGEGEMMLKPEPVPAPKRDEGPAIPYHNVPLVEIWASAGPLKAFHQEGVDLSSCHLVPTTIPGAELAVPISGDSMEPMIPNGATVYLKRILDKNFIPWGKPAVIDTDNGAFIKVIEPDPDDRDCIVASSINSKYPPMHIPKASIFALYRVLGLTQMFLCS